MARLENFVTRLAFMAEMLFPSVLHILFKTGFLDLGMRPVLSSSLDAFRGQNRSEEPKEREKHGQQNNNNKSCDGNIHPVKMAVATLNFNQLALWPTARGPSMYRTTLRGSFAEVPTC